MTVEVVHASVTGGVDTHKDTHAVAALDNVGRLLGTAEFSTTAQGESDLLAWLASFGRVHRVGVEGTGSWGKNLSRYLHQQDIEVLEVRRPSREHIRRHGKSDPTDAIAAARATLAHTADGTPKDSQGAAESIRTLRTIRRSAMKSKITTANQIHAVIATAPHHLRETLRGLGLHSIVTESSRYRPHHDLTDPVNSVRWALRRLARRYQGICEEIREVDTELDALVRVVAPAELLAEHGVGTETAAVIITAIGDNPERVTSDGALAGLAGISPVDASSGRNQRHRYNRGGNRELNNAIWRIIMVRLRWHEPTRVYMAKRRAEGKTKREVIRCLKRYLIRRIFKIYQRHLNVPKQPQIAA